MTVMTSTPMWSPATTPEPDQQALTGEHALLLRDLRRRVDPVLALIAAHAWPAAELHTLVRFLRTDVLRQASDEEVLLYPNGARAPFPELSADHARLHALADRLEHADPATYSLRELGRTVRELLGVFERHLAAEEAALAVFADAGDDVPAAAELRSRTQAWLTTDDTPVLIVLDVLPRERAVQMCVERLLRLRPGQCADVHSSREAEVRQVCRWIRDFDSVSYGLARLPSAGDWSGLRVSRRHGP